MSTNKIQSWQMVEPGKDFVLTKKPVPEIKHGEVLVEIAGCGVCHTDIGFHFNNVKTRKLPPLALGHEISGTVIEGDSRWLNKKVIIPAVLPCGECDLCKTNRSNVCRHQKMPGNDFDGGFSSHIIVPSRFLCPVPEELLKKYSLSQLSVIADAISTPYQVIEKSELQKDDLAIIIGVGGVGIYASILAKIKGAKVIAIDIDDHKLHLAKENGADGVINSLNLTPEEVKTKVKELVSFIAAPKLAWKIFEISGTKSGQVLAFNLLTFASTFSVVGFTMDKLEVRLSNLMAFDAKLIGTWGCKPELYPEVVKLISDGKIPIEKFVETRPMSTINQVFQDAHHKKFVKRIVLTPDF